MYTKEDTEKAKQYLENEGYGTKSNFTLNVVANLMAEYAAKNCVIPAVSVSVLSDEEMREPVENALYATKRFLTTQATDLAEGIIQYIKDAGYTIARTER